MAANDGGNRSGTPGAVPLRTSLVMRKATENSRRSIMLSPDTSASLLVSGARPGTEEGLNDKSGLPNARLVPPLNVHDLEQGVAGQLRPLQDGPDVLH